MTPRIKAFRFITRCLANDNWPESIEALRAEIRSAQLSWEAVVSLANAQLITPALWIALEKKGLTEVLPDELCTYLGEIHRLNAERNKHLQVQLLEAVKQLNSINVSPILLKGAMHLVNDIYSDPGVRIMTDIDLLVPREDIDRCMESLRELQYEPVEDIHNDYHEEHHHCAPLHKPGAFGALEIHRKIMESPYEDILPTELAMTEAKPIEFHELSMKVLSPTHRVLHNILHSQLVDQNYHTGTFSLRSLYETVTEATTCHEIVDWSTIHLMMEQSGRSKVLRTYLYQTGRLLDFALPAGIPKTPCYRFYYWRCVAGLGWHACERIGRRVNRYSADNIGKIYGCNDGWIPINLARLKQVKRRVLVYIDDVKQRLHWGDQPR